MQGTWAGQECYLSLLMWGRGLVSPQLPGSTARERAELTQQQNAVHSHMPRACRGRRSIPQESRQLAFAACPSRPVSCAKSLVPCSQLVSLDCSWLFSAACSFLSCKPSSSLFQKLLGKPTEL